jgi:hypothetical protein
MTSEYVEGENLIDMIKEDLVARRVAIETIANWSGISAITIRLRG